MSDRVSNPLCLVRVRVGTGVLFVKTDGLGRYHIGIVAIDDPSNPDLVNHLKAVIARFGVVEMIPNHDHRIFMELLFCSLICVKNATPGWAEASAGRTTRASSTTL